MDTAVSAPLRHRSPRGAETGEPLRVIEVAPLELPIPSLPPAPDVEPDVEVDEPVEVPA